MREFALIDPSKNSDDNLVANNIGDEIIFNAINANFLGNIKELNLHRYTSHRSLTDQELQEVNACEHVFFGGTNIVSVDVCHHSKWLPQRKKFYYLMPGIKKLIFIGVGMNSYSTIAETTYLCNLRTKLFYKNILSKDYIHSVRDHQTEEVLKSLGIKNVLFTSCPTLWTVDGDLELNSKKKTKKCIFALTDYQQDPVRDNKLIKELTDHFEELCFFPQGLNDTNYIKQLDNYLKYQKSITILPRTLKYLQDILNKDEYTYIGTRLHLGIFFMNKGIKSLIIGIDNRAVEMKKSVNLPVILPSELHLITTWINGEKLFGKLHLPFENISKWKNQFI